MGKRYYLIAAVIFTSALFLIACQKAPPPAKEIKIGHLADLTGPTSSVGKPYAAGVQAYKDHINGKGGINGKKIDMQAIDYAYDKNKAINQYKKYLEEKVIAVQGWGTGDTEALTGFLAADKIHTFPLRTRRT